MNYAAIKNCDIANGPGVRVSLFVSGCTHHCPGCFQPETWDFNYGEKFTDKTIWKILSLLEPNYISGLTILGGEPLEPQNMPDVYVLLYQTWLKFKNKKSVWLYTGSTWEGLQQRTGYYKHYMENIFDYLDVLVDGPFIESQKNIGLQFRGSENQRIIDLRKTRTARKIVLWDGKERSN